MWFKIPWRHFVITFAIIAMISAIVMFIFGMPCDDNFEGTPKLCKAVFLILYVTNGIAYFALWKISKFFENQFLFSLVISWGLDSYIILILSKLFKRIIMNKKS